MTNEEIRDANIFRYDGERAFRTCALCGQRMPDNSLAMSSHGNKHVVAKEAEVVWFKGISHTFPVKRYIATIAEAK